MMLLPHPAHSLGPEALLLAAVDTETGVGPVTATVVRAPVCSPPDSGKYIEKMFNYNRVNERVMVCNFTQEMYFITSFSILTGCVRNRVK